METDKIQHKDLVSHIFEQCLKINENTVHGAIFEFAGHANMLDVRITKTKDDYNIKIYKVSLFVNYTDNIKPLSQTIKALEKILEDARKQKISRYLKKQP